MKNNKDLLYDDNWLDSLFNNITSIRTHCKKIIEYEAAEVPDCYAGTHDECKTGCQLYLDGIKKYVYGVDLEDGNARVEGRGMMQEATAILTNAVSSLQ